MKKHSLVEEFNVKSKPLDSKVITDYEIFKGD